MIDIVLSKEEQLALKLYAFLRENDISLQAHNSEILMWVNKIYGTDNPYKVFTSTNIHGNDDDAGILSILKVYNKNA